MITTPDRLAAVAQQIERGEPVDLKKVAVLQAIDLVRAGRQFAEESASIQEQANEFVKQQFGGDR